MQEIATYALFRKNFPGEHAPGRRTPLPCATAPGPPASGTPPPLRRQPTGLLLDVRVHYTFIGSLQPVCVW